jgi:hypothetical protein
MSSTGPKRSQVKEPTMPQMKVGNGGKEESNEEVNVKGQDGCLRWGAGSFRHSLTSHVFERIMAG